MKKLLLLLLIPVFAQAQQLVPQDTVMLMPKANSLSLAQLQAKFNLYTPSSTAITTIGVTTANGVSAISSGGTTPNLTVSLGAIAPATVNGNIITTGTGTLTMAAGTTLKNLVSFTLDGAGKATLVSGTKAVTVTGITTSSIAVVSFVSAGGTISTTTHYAGVCTANTLTITALTSTSTTNTSDTSTISYIIVN